MSEELEALTTRQEGILRAVCREYIVTGGEVSSGALAQMQGIRWSPATVRAELAALERGGFLTRPHASAGRRPTRRGLECYVAGLGSADMRPELVAAVDHSLRDASARPEDSMRTAVYVLSEVAGCVAVSFWGRPRAGVVRDVQLVPLVRARALVVLTMESGAQSMHPVTIERLAATEPDLVAAYRRLQERLRSLCVGRTLPEAHAELLCLQNEHEARFDRLLAEALRVGLALTAGVWFDPLWLQVAGKPSLARELGPADSLSGVLELLEDTQRLAEVLCQLLPEPTDELRAQVRVDAGDLLLREGWPDAALGGLGGLALVGCRLPEGAGGSDPLQKGAVALLGTDRMDYAAVIPLVEYAARALAARMCA